MKAYWEWRHQVIEEIIVLAPLLPTDTESGQGEDRALCPLCQASSTGYSKAPGFKVASGLRRHLEGSHRTEMCPVIEVVMDMRWKEVLERRHGNGSDPSNL